MSVLLSTLLGARSPLGLTSEKLPFLVSWVVSLVESEFGLRVEPDPDRGTSDIDAAHGFVIGKKTGSIRKRMCRAATWVKPDKVPAKPCPGS